MKQDKTYRDLKVGDMLINNGIIKLGTGVITDMQITQHEQYECVTFTVDFKKYIRHESDKYWTENQHAFKIVVPAGLSCSTNIEFMPQVYIDTLRKI